MRPNLATRHKRLFDGGCAGASRMNVADIGVCLDGSLAARGSTRAPIFLFALDGSITAQGIISSRSLRAMGAVAKPSRWLIAVFLVFFGLAIAGIVLAVLGRAPPIVSPTRSFSIPSASMEPTLHVGEYFLANMRAFQEREPARGDIVVMTLPRDPSMTWVKRIIGLPGEKVQMKNGILHIDGQAVPTVDAGTYKLVSAGQPEKSVPLKRETLPNGVSFTTIDLVSNGFYDNTPVYQVPENHYFALGDNRDNSTDSRVLSQFGYVPRANVIGRISWIYWSPDLSRIGTMPK
jgi:signal peptidase I